MLCFRLMSDGPDTKKVVRTLNSLCAEMDQRYDLLKLAKTRNIKEYNAKFCSRKLSPAFGHRYLPYIVLIIDEFGDLIMTAGREVEMPIARLAQLARAIGIHLVIATQRPSPAYLAEPPFYAAAAVPPQFISVPCILFLYAAVAVPPQTSTFYLFRLCRQHNLIPVRFLKFVIQLVQHIHQRHHIFNRHGLVGTQHDGFVFRLVVCCGILQGG